MRLFIDTANLEEIRQAAELGVISGVTTNPSLIAKEGKELAPVIREICNIVHGPISAEVMSLDAAGMVDEARILSKIHPNVVIKVPMCLEGLKAVSKLSAIGIQTNVTLIFSSAQALMAARAGATYVSPFLGRLDDVGQDGLALIQDIVEIFSLHGLDTQIIAASIRHPIHVVECARLGAHIATIPYKVLMQLVEHPLTTVGIERFIADWSKSQAR